MSLKRKTRLAKKRGTREYNARLARRFDVGRVLLAGAADYVTAKVYDRDGLAPGDAVAGPAIIEQSDTTTLIDPGWTAKVADNGVLLMTREAA